MTDLPPIDPFAPILDAVATRAALRPDPQTGAGDDGLDREIAALAEAGILRAPIRRTGQGFSYDFDRRRSLPLLVRLGGADLSLGRLVEGHLNALQLVALYGGAAQQRRVAEAVDGGALMGVWGADGAAPLRCERGSDGSLRLHGAKRYCSGLGLVSLAVVSHTAEDGTLNLLLVDVAEPARADRAPWRMRGMRASRSGDYDFEGMALGADAVLGAPDDYRREPFFVGGIWRCAAVQLGAIERIVSGTVEALQVAGRADHPLQLARIGEAILAARDARLQVTAAAEAVEEAGEGRGDAALATSLAGFARLRVESAGMTAVALAERSVGLGMFCEGHALERPTRDLSVYLRQANPDQLLLGHTRHLLTRLPEIFR
ncbi:acyl-CoA dehydrogenase family protein [Aureimonas pseudogalii]|uniref:Alkylation response protein AidB-like acyl-CoA dehydrogenase n=1 Tax=Aureimonas pseudogalii TaxID=1744844 RepID=A0A7W6H6C6_9HYPH|nr:acyl-CoA dehydrogenase family protein [Aureimonas pseudogalii]MBB3999379.1 alkylation response protein AidB-like acyl-CoA dehydrogenase [Aureimonas pseudogalii]